MKKLEITIYETKEVLPPKHTYNIISGGVGYWNGFHWSDENYEEIERDVLWWTPLIYDIDILHMKGG